MKNINQRKDKKHKSEIIEDLLIAKNFYKRPFTGREFDKVSKNCKRATVFNYFKTWNDALKEVDLDKSI